MKKVQPIRDNILFFFPGKEYNDSVKFKSGVELYIDPSYEPTTHIKDQAIAFGVGGQTDIPKGSFVYINYLMASALGKEPHHKDEDGVYYMGKEKDVFLWESKDQIQTIGNWIIVKLDKTESQSSIIIMPEEKQERMGVIKFMNEKIGERLGIKIGDKVLLEEKYNYTFKYKEEELTRVDSNIGLLGLKQ